MQSKRPAQGKIYGNFPDFPIGLPVVNYKQAFVWFLQVVGNFSEHIFFFGGKLFLKFSCRSQYLSPLSQFMVLRECKQKIEDY